MVQAWCGKEGDILFVVGDNDASELTQGVGVDRDANENVDAGKDQRGVVNIGSLQATSAHGSNGEVNAGDNVPALATLSSKM